jgi:pilus assembly protein FimV
MQFRRSSFALSASGAMGHALLLPGLLWAGQATAAGLGSGDAGATLGQPLNFGVMVRLDAGETLSAECVSAEVALGDRRLPPSLVRTSIEMTSAQTARIRVQTQSTVDEPVVAVQLSVGCSNRISRSYVVLADPPGMTSATTSAPAPSFAVDPPPVPAAAAPAPTGSEAAPLAAAAPTATTAPRAQPVLTPEQQRARDERRARQREQRLARQQAAREARAARAEATAAATTTAPRLRLDFVDATPRVAGSPAGESEAVVRAMAAVAEAASAARSAASAASASALRVAALEQEVATLRGEAKAGQELVALMRQRVIDAESSGRWTMPLVLASLLLAALAAWLAWRLGRVQALQRSQWRQEAAGMTGGGPVTSATAMGLVDSVVPQEPTTMAPFGARQGTGREASSTIIPGTAFNAGAVAPTVALPKPVASRSRVSPAWPPPAPPVAWPPAASTLPPDLSAETLPGLGPDMHGGDAAGANFRPEPEPEAPMQRTEPYPSGGRNADSTPRDVSIEELLDLEQQAEFFMVLGQDEAAVDLLVEHLRSTGGGSPLPYLKLLEIHHRRGDNEAYERMRQRFNHRFNAYAPEWSVGLTSGRSLEDYEGVVPRLQQVWARPLDAMAELEALLYSKSRGELFDLPAYREVLFLYALARDLLDRSSVDTGSVDLLLPMNDGIGDGGTSAPPFLGLEHRAFRDTMPPEDTRPTAPLDLDHTVGEGRTSIFDLLDDKPRPPRQP